MLKIVFTVIKRDLRLAMRRRAELLTVIFFFIISVSLFPIAMGPETEQEARMLKEIAPIIIWISALLATMLSLGQMFSSDYQDGTLEQLILIPQPFSLIVFGKIIAHWLVAGLPLVLIAPLLGMQLGLSVPEQLVLMLTLLMGTPALSLIGAMGAGLTLGLRNSNILVSLLVLPLYVPVMIYGAGSVEAYATGLGFKAHMALMSAVLLLTLILLPWAAATAVRISME